MGDGSGVRRWIGVTGHRDLADPARVAGEVDGVLEELTDHGIGALGVVSGLAEGADRLVAARVLARPDGRLVALLPLDPDDYSTDFSGPASVAEFNDLLGAADEVVVIPADPDDASRPAAYEAAGLAMLDRVDALVALWDGAVGRGRGGTAEMVVEARQRGLDVRVLNVERSS